MLYLFLAVFCSVSVASLIKIGESAGCNRIAVACANYIVALLLSLILWQLDGRASFSSPTVITGIYAGCTWVAGLLTMMYAVKIVGVAVTSTTARLSVALPILAGILLFAESPNTMQYIGLALCGIALILLSYRKKNSSSPLTLGALMLLPMVWLAGGAAELSGKLFAEYCPPDEKYSYLTVLFVTAVLITTAFLYIRRVKAAKRDLVTGAAIGVPNALSGLFIVLALLRLDAVVVYPTAAASVVAIMAALGILVWRERLRTLGYLGITIALAAVVLINLPK